MKIIGIAIILLAIAQGIAWSKTILIWKDVMLFKAKKMEREANRLAELKRVLELKTAK